MKMAVIFGVTGQDGSYLSEFLLDKGYCVVGVARRTSGGNLGKIGHLLERKCFHLVRGDVTDAVSVRSIIHGKWEDLSLVWAEGPLEVYNLAAQSHVGDSFSQPYDSNCVTYLGALNCLEAIRALPTSDVRFYQASSSEMFGSSWSWRDGNGYVYHQQTPPCRSDITRLKPYQSESTPLRPNSPYAVAKTAAHDMVRIYRAAYGLFACSGILYNHESERRGAEFVTRKITLGLGRIAGAIKRGRPWEPISLGNLEAYRDWGHAEDYVRGMWLMLRQECPDDYVLATGVTHTVREFLDEAVAVAGLPSSPLTTQADPTLLRPCEVPYLRGDASRAKRVLGWEPKVTFKQMVRRMVEWDGMN